MSESLTNEKLDDIDGYFKAWGILEPQDIAPLISMARRTLQAEERLEKAVEALQIYSECACTSMYKCGRCRVIDEDLLGGPKDLHPPAQCAPLAVTDAPPDEEPDLEAMRKGLDDHSCNSTGWEKP